jgi:CubicO group peptidase (beta-lactamase class C family)
MMQNAIQPGWGLRFLGQILIFHVVAQAGPAVAQSNLDRAFGIIEQAVTDQVIPGATALIMRDGKLIEQRTYGARQLDPEVPFTENTICWVASLTKPVTAAAAMKLVEQGKLDLDLPIERYLPEFAHMRTEDGQRHSVTARQLMSHCSGIPASVPLRESYFFTQGWFARSLEQVASATAARPLEFVPGTQTKYSNAAPYVLGRIIEVCSGSNFGDFVQREILEPLDMQDTAFSVASDKQARAAVVYRREGSELRVYCRYDPQWQVKMTMPDGGLFATAGDFARFANFFLEGGGDVLSATSVETMLTLQSEGYGLGWILDKPQQFSHWGSSGTLVWADRSTGVVGVFFSQIQDFQRLEHLREQFRSAVDDAFSK